MSEIKYKINLEKLDCPIVIESLEKLCVDYELTINEVKYCLEICDYKYPDGMTVSEIIKEVSLFSTTKTLNSLCDKGYLEKNWSNEENGFIYTKTEKYQIELDENKG